MRPIYKVAAGRESQHTDSARYLNPILHIVTPLPIYSLRQLEQERPSGQSISQSAGLVANRRKHEIPEIWRIVSDTGTPAV
ncbi:MAG: hypothetical protein MHMPM18_003110 [Marteilia pararefringens]